MYRVIVINPQVDPMPGQDMAISMTKKELYALHSALRRLVPPESKEKALEQLLEALDESCPH